VALRLVVKEGGYLGVPPAVPATFGRALLLRAPTVLA